MSDAWGIEESQQNKVGTQIVVVTSLLGALFVWGIVPVHLDVTVLFAIVSVGGLVGGALNVAGRGPLWAGAVVGLVIGLGGFSAVYLWIESRESVFTLEIMIAFVVGCIPGFLLQHFMPKMLGKSPE